MTQEDKELLLKDICARLPYKVKIMRYVERNNKINELIPELNLSIRLVELFIGNDGFIIKPYLRPMSSMTEKERKEYERFSRCSIGLAPILMDWLYSHHLDCCGLIPKGLALEAKEGMYNL